MAEYKLWAHEKTHAKVHEILSSLPRGRLLDIGAGEGAMSAAAKEMGFTVAACDHQPGIFKAPGIECSPCNLDGGLPFPEASFDHAVCIETVEHLRDRYAFLAECARVIRPGGTLVVTTPNILNMASRFKYLFSGFFPLFSRPVNEFEPDPTHTHINPVTYYHLRHALVAGGFELHEARTDRFRLSAMLLAWMYPALLFATARSMRKEHDPRQREANREIRKAMNSAALLFGRTLIVAAKRLEQKDSAGENGD